VASTGQSSETACPSGDTTASTASTSQSACVPIKTATTLTAAPQFDAQALRTSVGLGVVSATLTSAGHPVSGQPVSFSVGATVLCTANTNSSGVATCLLTLKQELAVVLANSYSASFAGSSKYTGSNASTNAVIL
jgi:hypothetical protein